MQPLETPGPPTDAPAASAAGSSRGTWPCSACLQRNDLALAVCDACGTPFLAGAREDRPTLVLPLVGDVLALDHVRRLGLAACVAGAVVLVIALLALLAA